MVTTYSVSTLDDPTQHRPRPTPKGGGGNKASIVLWLMILLMIVALIWASVARVDQVTRATGSVIASSRVQVIQAVDGGALAELKVKEGDRVERGQVLAQLEQGRSAAAVAEIDAKLAALRAQAMRLRAEALDAAEPVFPPELLSNFPEVISAQRALFRQKRSGLQEELRTLKVAVALATEDAGLISQLAASGDVSRSEVIRAQRALNEADAQLVNRRNKYFQDARTELAKVEDDLGQAEQVRTQRAQQVMDSVIKAPVGGIVKNVRITTQGGVLRAGDELLQIVPVDDQMVIEAKVRPSEIAQIKPGLPANIRFDPFDYTVYGAVAGKVTYVSADTLKEDTRTGEQTYYRVHIATSAAPVRTQTGNVLEVLPGMTAQVDIRTGDRSMMDYLLKPLRKTLTESLGER
jgi:adhesin transport system membrane fusion protein